MEAFPQSGTAVFVMVQLSVVGKVVGAKNTPSALLQSPEKVGTYPATETSLAVMI